MSKKLPKFESRKEAAKFWATHDTTDYWDDMEDVDLKVHPSIKSPRDLSRRCPVCDQVLRFRYVDRDSRDSWITMHLMEFYCPEGHVRQLADESAKLARAIEAVLDLRASEERLTVEELDLALASEEPELAPA